MEQQKLTFLITHLILRIRDYPADAVDELLSALDAIEHKYDIVEQLSDRERQAILESRQEVAPADRHLIKEAINMGLNQSDRDEIGKRHFEIATKHVRMRDPEEQGDISDLLFASIDEYFIDTDEFK